MFETSPSEPRALANESARRTLALPAVSLGFLLFYQAVVPLLAATFGGVPRVLFEAVRFALAIGGAGGAWTLVRHLRHRASPLRFGLREVLWIAATLGATTLALHTLVSMSLPRL